MALILLFALRAATQAGSAALLPVDFDLAAVRPAEPDDCGGGGSEIVVCGRRANGGAYPLEAMARIFEPKPLKAERALGGGATGSLFVDSVTVPDGQVSKRVMIGVKMKF